mgnify:CR=1 FL=1
MEKRIVALLTSLLMLFGGATVALADIASRDDAYAESGGGFTLPVIVGLVAVVAVLAARFIIGSKRK